MATPRQHRDPETERRLALGQVSYTFTKPHATERSKQAVIQFASDAGASVEELAEASGLSAEDVEHLR